MRSRFNGLWRQRDFMRLWAGQTISAFGSLLGALGLTALLILDATPMQMGILGTLGALPVLLVGLQAGVWVDRLRRRPILIVADVGRALLLLSVPVAAMLNLLRIEQLYVVAFLTGALTVFFDVAYQSILPSLVRREQLIEGNSKLGTSSHLAEVAAPAVGGLLVQTLGAPLTVLLDALSFLGSALFIARIRTPEPPPEQVEQQPSMRHEIVAGLRLVLRNRVLRVIAGSEAIDNFFGGFFAAVYGLFIIRTLGLPPVLIGIAIGFGGIGALIGTTVAGWATRRWGMGPTIVRMALVMAIVGPLTPLASGPAIVAIAMVLAPQLIGDLARAIYVINERSLRQTITPDRLLGRTNASMHFLVGSIGMVGILVGGALGEMIGVRATLGLAVAGGASASLLIAFSPLRTV